MLIFGSFQEPIKYKSSLRRNKRKGDNVMVTIHDVAARSGVSIATVSNVINKTKKVSPETESRVREAMKELNYVPNVIAKSLKTNNYKSIGVIAEDISSFSTPPIIDAIGNFLSSQGYMVNLCNLRTYSHSQYDTALLQSSLNTLAASRTSGIIYIGANSSNVENIRHLINLPAIYAYTTAGAEGHTINYDDFNAAKMAAKLFLSHHHKRIAIITGDLGQEFVHQRIMGFRSAMDEERIPLPPGYIVVGNWDYTLAHEQALKLLSLSPRPTAIFAMNDPMACAVLAAARRLGLRVPEDLSIIGFDDRSCSAYSSPSITTLHIPFFDIGSAAASSLLDLLNEKKVPVNQILSCRLIERESVADAPNL